MADERSALCEAIEAVRSTYPQPALIDDVRSSVRQVESLAETVGAGGGGVEEAMVSAWLAILYHEAQAMHAALDTLHERYCREP